jgi:hypothetical protein
MHVAASGRKKRHKVTLLNTIPMGDKYAGIHYSVCIIIQCFWFKMDLSIWVEYSVAADALHLLHLLTFR